MGAGEVGELAFVVPHEVLVIVMVMVIVMMILPKKGVNMAKTKFV